MGIDEGATLVIGGTDRPAGLDRGYFIRPTVFANVSTDMVIAREEIFGPVIVLIGYEDEPDALRIASDTDYWLGGMCHRAILIGLVRSHARCGPAWCTLTVRPSTSTHCLVVTSILVTDESSALTGCRSSWNPRR
jgi:acyl-CoA reductase-like NAD-dependent aldehyde dehydrogenase